MQTRRSCDYLVTRPRRAPLGSPARRLPSITKRCGEPAATTFLREAYVDRGIEVPRAEKRMCDAHAAAFEGRGVSVFKRVTA